MRNSDKFRGCLVGGAIGDALGYPVEFMRISEIREKYGPKGITRYDPRRGLARISDDTQMTLFTAVGLLFGQTRGMLRGIGGNGCGFIANAYWDWYATQSRFYPLPEDYRKVSWLVNFEEFFIRRAPGNTCMNELRKGRNGGRGTIKNPLNDKKGCGGVMRVAPIGLYFCDKEYWTVEAVDMAGADAAAITHGHELGYIPAAALVHIVNGLASGRFTEILPAVRDSMASMKRLFPEAEHMDEFISIMQKAIDLAAADTDDLEAIDQIGRGWVAEETLAISVYCALKYPHDFEKAMIAAVNHDGDSDSTGAVTGNILGTYLGYDALPEFFKKDLELLDIILEIADDLCSNCRMEEGGDYEDLIWESKYIRIDYDREKKKQFANG